MYLFNPSSFLWFYCHDSRSNGRRTHKRLHLSFLICSVHSWGLQPHSTARHSSSNSKLTHQLPLLLKIVLVFSKAVRKKTKVITMPFKKLQDLVPVYLFVPTAPCHPSSFMAVSPLNMPVVPTSTLKSSSVWKALQLTAPPRLSGREVYSNFTLSSCHMPPLSFAG